MNDPYMKYDTDDEAWSNFIPNIAPTLRDKVNALKREAEHTAHEHMALLSRFDTQDKRVNGIPIEFHTMVGNERDVQDRGSGRLFLYKNRFYIRQIETRMGSHGGWDAYVHADGRIFAEPWWSHKSYWKFKDEETTIPSDLRTTST